MFIAEKRKYIFWSRVTAIAVVLFPLSLHHVDFRSTFSLGVSVSAHKSSPAYAALEDLRENYAHPFPAIPEQGHLIKAGQTFDMKVAQRMPAIRQLAMKGLTIRRPSATELKPFLVAGEVMHKDAAISRRLILESKGELLPLAERKQRILERLRDENWSVPAGPGALAEKLAQQELRGMLKPIVIRRTASNEIVPPPPPAQTISALSTHNPDPNDMRPLWVSGQVEMTGGLAFMGPETQMVVRRVFNGQNFEQGRIWVTEGKFEIHVKKPIGFVVAELQTRDGRVLGHGEVNLLDLGLPQKDNHIMDIRIALHPTAEGVMFHTISGYSHGGQKMPIADARVEIQAYSDAQKVNAEGAISEPTLSRDSSFVARALAKNHWASLVVGQAGEPQEIRLFANSLVDALLSLNLSGTDKLEAYHQSIVWGQVTQGGGPVADVQVEMAGDYRPIYFNEMYLPDVKMQGTSSNGLFAFVKVKTGVQALRVKIGSKVYPAQIFPTEEKHVSYIEVGIRERVISQFRVFDGLEMNKPVASRIRLVGTDETLPVAKDDFVAYSVAANPFLVEAEAGAEYELSRVTVTGSPHVVHIPLVQREWLYRLSVEKNVSPIPRRGNIVGYMDDHDFEVELTGYAPGEVMQIVYFDAQGKALDTKTGVAGGGFVIFNAPQGLQTVYIHPTQSRETFSQVVVAEPEFVQVVTH